MVYIIHTHLLGMVYIIHTHLLDMVYIIHTRIAGNFRGVLIFVIFVTIPRVTKFSTHEFFHPRIFSRLLTSFAYRASGVTKFKTTKINSEDPRQLFTKICTPENYPLYGTHLLDMVYIIHIHLLGMVYIINTNTPIRHGLYNTYTPIRHGRSIYYIHTY